MGVVSDSPHRQNYRPRVFPKTGVSEGVSDEAPGPFWPRAPECPKKCPESVPGVSKRCPGHAKIPRLAKSLHSEYTNDGRRVYSPQAPPKLPTKLLFFQQQLIR